jgi:hypothetical protein
MSDLKVFYFVLRQARQAKARQGTTTLSKIAFSIMTFVTRGYFTTLSITKLYHYAECRVLFVVMLNVVMLSVVAPKESKQASLYNHKQF